MTVCDSTLGRYVVHHHDSLCFRIMTVCSSPLWQFVIPHYDSMWFHIMTVCDSTLWRYVIPHYDSMWFHIMTVCDSMWWLYAIPQYSSLLYILLHCVDLAETYFKHVLWELCSKIPAWKRRKAPVTSCKKSVCIYLDRLVSETMNLFFVCLLIVNW